MEQVQILTLLTAALAIQYSLCEVPEVFVESGFVAVLPCVIQPQNQYSSAVIWLKITEGRERTVWRRDKSGLEFRPAGRAPRAHCPHTNFREGNYSLLIESTKEEDAGLYRCIVDEGREFKDVMLRIVKVSLSPTEVVEGQRLEMTCSITPKLSSVMINWEINGSHVETYNQIHVIIKASQRDSGTWSCLVQYRGSEGMASASLQVKGILVPVKTHTMIYAELGSSVTLPCIFSEQFILNSISWKKASNATHLSASHSPVFKNSSSSEGFIMQYDRSALIKNVQEEDEGTYRCSGQMKGATGNRVAVERNIQLVTAQIRSLYRKGSLTLTCHISDTNQVTEYEWFHKSYGINSTQFLTPFKKSSSNVLRISKVEEKHLGEWVCLYYCQQQLLGNVTYLHMMSGLEGQKETTSGSNVALIIGLGFLVLIVLLVSLQMYKNHRRRKMIMQYPAMETIVHLAANEREFRERSKISEKAVNAACGDNPQSMCV